MSYSYMIIYLLKKVMFHSYVESPKGYFLQKNGTEAT